MAAGQPNPHDALFRRVLGRPEHAASELRSVLPPALTDQLELDRLTPVPGSFVDDHLRWRHCDQLFTTRARDRDALVYVLMEHQSRPDPFMAWRVLRYVTRIWDAYLADHPDATMLPVVVPLVVYHGQVPWRHSVELADLFDLDAALAADPAVAPVLPRFAFLLDDVSHLGNTALRDRALTAPARMALLLLARAAGHDDLAGELRQWTADLRTVLDRPDGMEIFRALMTYIHLVADESTDGVRDVVRLVGPDAEEAYVTIAERLRAEGKAEGRAEGRAEALLQLLELRFGTIPGLTARAVLSASTEQVEAWTARVITAPTLDDVLR